MKRMRSLAGAIAVLVLAAAPALAQPPDRGPTPGLGWGPGGSKDHAVPAPVAGIGLPALLAAGVGLWLARRRARSGGPAR